MNPATLTSGRQHDCPISGCAVLHPELVRHHVAAAVRCAVVAGTEHHPAAPHRLFRIQLAAFLSALAPDPADLPDPQWETNGDDPAKDIAALATDSRPHDTYVALIHADQVRLVLNAIISGVNPNPIVNVAVRDGLLS